MGLFRKASPKEKPKPAIKALLFDTFGTTVDWLSSMTAHGQQLGTETGIDADWEGLAREWRAQYKPAIKPVREGKRPWTGFNQLLREELDKVARQFGAAGLGSTDRDRLSCGWNQLGAWPEVPAALHRLKKHFILAPLSNGTTRQLVDIAKYANLPWDVIFGADLFGTYKPDPRIYQGAVRYLDCESQEVLLVAAHNGDLQAAQEQGLRTCFVHRPTEDPTADGQYDYVVNDFEHLARVLGAV